MRPSVFIDGSAGTTGLRVREWLAGRDDLERVTLPEAQRKDPAARREATLGADVAILCLPDEAARELVDGLPADAARILDASVAHRTAEGFAYGLPELAPGSREAITRARRVSNPGCYAQAVILLLRPLVDEELLPADAALSIHALSGYSGGGRELIERWEQPDRGLLVLPYEAPYALERVHKHVPEMTRYARLVHAPHFVPAVGPFRCGMRVEVPLHAAQLPRGVDAKRLWDALSSRYRGERFVRVRAFSDPLEIDEHSFDPRACNGTNRIELAVAPNASGHVTLLAVLDNLGKGAAGVAIQNLNLMLGLPEERGLPA